MKYNNLFELSSTFEAASWDGTLAYPNLSLIEETGEISNTKEYDPTITFTIHEFISGTGYVDNVYTAERDMTWEEWCNSDYNTSTNNWSVREYDTDDFRVWYSPTGTTNGVQYYIATEFQMPTTVVSASNIITPGFVYQIYSTCCFVAGTKVTMADSSLKNIEDIVAGESVKSYNIETGEVYNTYVKNTIINPNIVDLLTVTLEDGTVLKMNEYHPLYTRTGWHSHTNYSGYDTLIIGDEVKTYEGWSKIVDMSLERTDVTTYNLNVCDFDDMEQTKDGENDNFFANGVVAHNAGCK